MGTATLTLLIGLVLAFANGANDTFKGVATLYGSRSASYRTALSWALAATLAGALVSILAAGALQARFSGYGLVDAATRSRERLPVVLSLAAGGTVLLATRLGMPISTTHALAGRSPAWRSSTPGSCAPSPPSASPSFFPCWSAPSCP